MPEGVIVTPDPIETAVSTASTEMEPSTPSQLPEEFKPYSQIPWSDIPEDAREGVLKGVKDFHGGMTKHQQELSELRKSMPELQERSRMLDQLVNEPWVREAYEAHQNGVDPNAPPAPQLTDQFDPEQASAIDRIVEQKIAERVGPVTSQLSAMQQAQTQAKAKSELDRMEAYAQEKGLPSPMERINDLYAQVSSGNASSVEQAYKLSVFDDIQKISEEKGRKATMAELQKKASTTVAPVASPSGTPGFEGFKGRNCVLDALRATINE